jgi:hypothetical protein
VGWQAGCVISSTVGLARRSPTLPAHQQVTKGENFNLESRKFQFSFSLNFPPPPAPTPPSNPPPPRPFSLVSKLSYAPPAIRIYPILVQKKPYYPLKQRLRDSFAVKKSSQKKLPIKGAKGGGGGLHVREEEKLSPYTWSKPSHVCQVNTMEADPFD